MREVAIDPRGTWRTGISIIGLVALVAALFWGIRVGTVPFSAYDIWNVFIAPASNEAYQIIYNIRVPRVLVGALTGINLALAGCILQGVLRNPLADPGIIGVSAGAGLAAMSVMILWPGLMALVPAAAFVGALLAAGIVFLLSWDRGIQPLRLILAGVALAAFFGGGMSALMVFHSDKVQGTVNWMAGGFQGRSWNHVQMILPYSLIGVLGTMLSYRHLNALQLGDEVAKGLGIRVEKARFFLVVLAALLAASAVSVAGLLGFVGLIIPHIARMLVGSDFEYLMPCAAVLGATIVVAADTVARTIFSPVEVPVGIFMAFLGAPFFIYLLRKGMRR
ncbi:MULTISPECIES: FecCD family ABC transporter permease [Pelosinus]|uniref:ABC-type transporter, integral membrane subunit n=1 Tax=Pelosinus fermentans B4 TaxID=1149862 RepID=I8RJV0_9FIRM|nr:MULTISPECIES: iron ABC transporter permease [Pelosinus]EIW20328.1 ABC-type transporter, integral membrane subunit [Pelosinus fermentans B4]EIW25613.1 ABC-type transporter, integral membrane subunit [Pelosinus fermentans A11]OAM93335.1 ABC-type transporter, integral membrane subunit [Pelosinus fermentans DSM 17108]SDQ74293.1 iron complex transport system permease protein [Pelosinus fermentans]